MASIVVADIFISVFREVTIPRFDDLELDAATSSDLLEDGPSSAKRARIGPDGDSVDDRTMLEGGAAADTKDHSDKTKTSITHSVS